MRFQRLRRKWTEERIKRYPIEFAMYQEYLRARGRLCPQCGVDVVAIRKKLLVIEASISCLRVLVNASR